MKRFIVSFAEIRRYEVIVEASDAATAMHRAKSGPEMPIWIKVELTEFAATQITGRDAL